MYLDFSDIPGHQNLFLDYLHEYENVQKFYERNFRAQETYEDLFKKVCESSRPHKAQLTEIVKLQYSDQKPSKILNVIILYFM